jgi:hypothetical protein
VFLAGVFTGSSSYRPGPGDGLFARAGFADGDIEPYSYTDIDRTAAAGLSLKGTQWGRPDDTFALAVNGISKIHQQFLNDGGLGILIGDGQLPHPGLEQIMLDNGLTGQIAVAFNNDGIVNVESGTLNLAGGGADVGATYEGSGTADFSAAHTLDSTSSITSHAQFGGGTVTDSRLSYGRNLRHQNRLP